MNGTLVVEEERIIIDNLKNWYKEKIIDTGISAKFEDAVNIWSKIDAGIVAVAGTVATIALTICPLDGPLGEICSALATPGLTALANIKGKVVKNAVVGVKRKIEGTFIGETGQSEKIEIPELDIKTIASDVVAMKDEAVSLASDLGKSL